MTSPRENQPLLSHHRRAPGAHTCGTPAISCDDHSLAPFPSVLNQIEEKCWLKEEKGEKVRDDRAATRPSKAGRLDTNDEVSVVTPATALSFSL